VSAGFLSWIVTNQLLEVTTDLPKYKHNLRTKLATVQEPLRHTLARASETLFDLQHEITRGPRHATPDRSDRERASSADAPPQTQDSHDNLTQRAPVPVQVVRSESSWIHFVRNWLGPLLAPLATAGIVTVFVIFMLINREDLRNRLLRLAGEQEIRTTTQLLDDAAWRVSRYLRTQLLLNSLYGIAVAAGLFAVGLPNAILWGLLGIVFRFIPYVGAWLTAGVASLLSLAVFDGWTVPIIVIGMFVVLELVINNILEPVFYGASTGVSRIGIVASVVFWTWLWGGVGLILATPLTVCVLVLGRHMPQLHFLKIILGDEEPLTPAVRLYQRLLAGDHDEAATILEDAVKASSREITYSDVVIPALAIAEHDWARGELSDDDEEFFLAGMVELIEDLTRSATVESPESLGGNGDEPHAARALPRIVCLPAQSRADEIAAQLFRDLLHERGYHVEMLKATSLSSERVHVVAEGRFDIAVVSAMMPRSLAHAAYLCKRMRSRSFSGKLLAGLWKATADMPPPLDRMQRAGVDMTAVTLSEALDQVQRWSGIPPATSNAPREVHATSAAAP
jgi:predicted PurR-regulated permease PerM